MEEREEVSFSARSPRRLRLLPCFDHDKGSTDALDMLCCLLQVLLPYVALVLQRCASFSSIIFRCGAERSPSSRPARAGAASLSTYQQAQYDRQGNGPGSEPALSPPPCATPSVPSLLFLLPAPRPSFRVLTSLFHTHRRLYGHQGRTT
jgi:hypothetical protein